MFRRADLRAVAGPLWAAILDCPLVAGLGDGCLDIEPFRDWVRQDHCCLDAYSGLFASGGALAPDLEPTDPHRRQRVGGMSSPPDDTESARLCGRFDCIGVAQ